MPVRRARTPSPQASDSEFANDVLFPVICRNDILPKFPLSERPVRGQWEVKMPSHWSQSLCHRAFPAFRVRGGGKRQKSLLETEFRLHYPIAINGLEVIFHTVKGDALRKRKWSILGVLPTFIWLSLLFVGCQSHPKTQPALHRWKCSKPSLWGFRPTVAFQ